MKLHQTQHRGLTLIEVLVIVATLGVLVVFLLPAFQRGTTHHSFPAGRCLNNLKQVALALRIFSSDHDGKFPWQVSTNPPFMQTPGSHEYAGSSEVFRHFLAASNELVTPKVLVCPTDPDRFKATNFGAFNNQNVSYFVALDADESEPNRLLSGDRNITGGILSNSFLRILRTNSAVGWTPALHTNVGNVALSDGSAMRTTSTTLQQQLSKQTLPVIRLAIP
jgi:hypothetical protein